MQTIQRHLAVALHRAMQEVGPVALTGPRGAGKTWLAQREFPRHLYVDLSDSNTRQQARSDPDRFLRRLRGAAILDEIHRAPELLQAAINTHHLLIAPVKLGLPNEFHLLKPSLAEREGRPPLDPLALGHLNTHRPSPGMTLARALETPAPDERRLEADLPALVRPHDLDRVLRLLGKLAEGPQIIDQSKLARQAGVTHPTVARWLDALERLFVIAQVPALDHDFGQRTVKRRKLVFLDHAWLPASNRFASFAASEIWKSYWHRGLEPGIAHWMTAGAETGFILEKTLAISFAAIPAAPPGSVQALSKWKDLAPRHRAALITTGHEPGQRQGVALHPWFAL